MITATEMLAISQASSRREVELSCDEQGQWIVSYANNGAVVAGQLSYDHAAAIVASWNAVHKLIGAVQHSRADADELRVILQAACRRGLLTGAEQYRLRGDHGGQS